MNQSEHLMIFGEDKVPNYCNALGCGATLLGTTQLTLTQSSVCPNPNSSVYVIQGSGTLHFSEFMNDFCVLELHENQLDFMVDLFPWSP